jgi:hypothetical protein
MNIAIKSGNTKACITATNNHCKYNINGAITGKFDPMIPFVAPLIQTTNIVSKIHHDIIFPYNLADRDITLANIPIISNSQTNNDIAMSNSLTINHDG